MVLLSTVMQETPQENQRIHIHFLSITCSVDFSTWGPFIIIFVILYLIFIGSRIEDTIVDLVINLNGLGIVKVGDNPFDDPRHHTPRQVGLGSPDQLTSQSEVGLGAGNAVHTKDAVEVANYLGLEMDGFLDSALVECGHTEWSA